MEARPTLLKVLVTQRHWTPYETFRAEYERVAEELELRDTAPSRAQYHRWLAGQLKSGAPYPAACRVLEEMFPEWTADALFGPADRAPTQAPTGDLLASVPASFPADVLQGAWVTAYEFSRPAKLHVDIARVHAESERQVRASNFPPEPRTEGHTVAFRNAIEARLANRHLVGQWKNSSDTRYFGALHLAVLPGEIVMEGYYTGYSSDIEVAIGHWKWVRLDPVSLEGVDLSNVVVKEPRILHKLVEDHTQYDAPLSLDAVAEE